MGNTYQPSNITTSLQSAPRAQQMFIYLLYTTIYRSDRK
jgi:hypothetical protein